MDYDQPLYRPPSEADSLIIQATLGCSANDCTFCLMYKSKKFRVRPLADVKRDIDWCRERWPDVPRVFLADGDALAIGTGQLLKILDHLRQSFPRLERVTSYANPHNLVVKSQEDLDEIKKRGLAMIYYGVESGDPDVLRAVKKKGTPAEMVVGVDKAHRAGLEVSVTVLLGLGGVLGGARHARLTAELLGRLQPEYVGALTLMLGPFEDHFCRSMGPDFKLPDKWGVLRELRELIAAAELNATVFRTNHASNWLPLAGVLRRDRDRLIRVIDAALENPDSGLLRPDWSRAL